MLATVSEGLPLRRAGEAPVGESGTGAAGRVP